MALGHVQQGWQAWIHEDSFIISEVRSIGHIVPSCCTTNLDAERVRSGALLSFLPQIPLS